MSLTPPPNFYDDFLLMDKFFPESSCFLKKRVDMKLDMRESESQYDVIVDLPGVDKSKIDVSIDNNILKISAERSSSVEENNSTYHYSERSFGSQSRSIRLPNNVNQDEMTAKYTDGVLNFIIPKIATTKSKSKSLKIN